MLFYPELENISFYEDFKEKIILLDRWFAFLPSPTKDSISFSQFEEKLELDYPQLNNIIQECCKLGLLEECFLLCCPKCKKVLKKTVTCDFFEDTLSIKYCNHCKSEIQLDLDNIYMFYKLLKTPTNDSDKIKILCEEIFKK